MLRHLSRSLSLQPLADPRTILSSLRVRQGICKLVSAQQLPGAVTATGPGSLGLTILSSLSSAMYRAVVSVLPTASPAAASARQSHGTVVSKSTQNLPLR